MTATARPHDLVVGAEPDASTLLARHAEGLAEVRDLGVGFEQNAIRRAAPCAVAEQVPPRQPAAVANQLAVDHLLLVPRGERIEDERHAPRARDQPGQKHVAVGAKADEEDIEGGAKRANRKRQRAKQQRTIVPNVHDLGSCAFEAFGDDDVA